MKKKPVFQITYEFDNPQLKMVWFQLMVENKDSMAIGLTKMMEEVGAKSDPVIYVKDDKDLIIVKKINTNKGFVFAYEDDKKEKIISKPYKLIPNNDTYMTLLEGQLIVWFRRTGGVDERVFSFASIDDAVNKLKEVVDPIDMKKEQDRLDAEWKKNHPEEGGERYEKINKIKEAIPKV